jgi:hypothetical protein
MDLMKILEAVLAVLVVVAFAIATWLKSHNKISDTQSHAAVGITQLVGGLLYAILSWQASSHGVTRMEHLFERVLNYLGLELTQFAIAVLIIGLGFAASWYKRKNKKWYGNIEIFVGMSSALVVARSLGPNAFDLAKWSTLAGCSYVIARGLGDHKEGMRDAK